MHLPQACFSISNDDEGLSLKTEVSEDVLEQTAVAQSNGVRDSKHMFTCERVVLAANMQFLNQRVD